MKLQKVFFQNQFGFSLIGALIGLGVTSMAFMAASQMISFSFKSQKSLELRLDRQAIARHLFSRVDCSTSFTPTTCASAGYKILRDSDSNIVVANTGTLTKFGNYTIQVECSDDITNKYLIVRAATLSTNGGLGSTLDSHFRADPMTNKIVKWDNDISLLFPKGVGICSEPGSTGSSGIVGSFSAYKAGGGATTIIVPKGVNFITFQSTSNGNGGGTDTTSEDTVNTSGLINLQTEKWSGYRALTGGMSANMTYSTNWNDTAFSVRVSESGDTSPNSGLHAHFEGSGQPMVSFDSTSRAMTIYALDPSTSSQVVVHFTFFK